MAKNHKCKYAHCKHESRELSPEEEVQYGNGYWHQDCLSESLAIRQIIDLFSTKCNKNVVMSQLRHVINEIVYNRGVEARMLLFGIQHYLQHHWKLNYPGGLYYVIQSKDVLAEWNKQSVKEMKTNFTVDDDNNGRKYEFKSGNEKDITKILC